MDKFETFYRQVDALTGDTAPFATGGYDATEEEKKSNVYMSGFNDGQDEILERLYTLLESTEDEISHEESVFYSDEEYSFVRVHDMWHILLNDTWYYACGDWEKILPEEYEEVVKWYRRFGHAGLLYWVWSTKRNCEYPQIPEYRKLIEAVDTLVNKKPFPDS